MSDEYLIMVSKSTEEHAVSFNEGYDEALRQKLGGAESREWFSEKVYPLLKDHMDPEEVYHVIENLADALLSEEDFGE